MGLMLAKGRESTVLAKSFLLVAVTKTPALVNWKKKLSWLGISMSP